MCGADEVCMCVADSTPISNALYEAWHIWGYFNGVYVWCIHIQLRLQLYIMQIIGVNNIQVPE